MALRVISDKHRSNVAGAHESHPNSLDAVVYVSMDDRVVDVEGTRTHFVGVQVDVLADQALLWLSG